MKVIHLADLHLGKRVNGFSMIEDQKYILKKIVGIIDDEKPNAILIAGDVYDRSIPSEEAVELLDGFLVDLAKRKLDVYIISGNHDSAERVAFGGRLMDASGIHMAPVYSGMIEPLPLSDEYGRVDFWLIPFLKPPHVRRFYPDETTESYTEAMETVIRHLNIDTNNRNIALVHQFITGASRCDSEEQSVGGLDDISAEVFAPFDYVALGHLHGPQYISREAVRYSGSPLKYSFSEIDQKKSVTVVELHEKGTATIREVPLTAMRDLKHLVGAFDEIMTEAPDTENYYSITLTDEEDVPNAMARLRTRYPNLMTMNYDNTRTRIDAQILASDDVQSKSPLTLFSELYEMQNNQPMNEEQIAFISGLINEIRGEQA